jgi:hypothetical protein
MGDQCRLRLFELAQYRLETQQQEKQRNKLLSLKEVTDRQRKSLPIEQVTPGTRSAHNAMQSMRR